MKYPTLEDIFLNFGFESEKTPGINEMNRVINGYLNRLVKAKKLSFSEANRIREQKSELETEAKAAGFGQGFLLAVKLFTAID
ncbi:MAG: hypothetical protein HDT24_01305 [Ruminococcus sp.]|nr:hypothetical protein [Ruminococcus sp.]